MTINAFKSLPVEKQELIKLACNNAGIDFVAECLDKEEKTANIRQATWLHLDAAAQIVGMSVHTVRRWALAGKIESRKLNHARCGRILIRRDSLYRFLESAPSIAAAAKVEVKHA